VGLLVKKDFEGLKWQRRRFCMISEILEWIH